MHTKFCSKTSKNISLLGFGFMRLPTTKTRRIDFEEAYKMFKYSVESGVTYFDTAWFYHGGNSETVLGQCIKKLDCREAVVVATKLPAILVSKKEDIPSFFTRQLKRLQTDYIDVYLLHAINLNSYNKLKSLGVIEFLNEKKEQGTIKSVGFSFHGPKSDIKSIIDDYDWDVVQLQYNILDTEVEEEIEYAKNKDIDVVIMEPLRGGMLAGNIPTSVEKLYQGKGTPAKWAFKYIYNNPNISTVLSGMSTIEQLEENIIIASSETTITKQEQEIYDNVKAEFNRLLRVNCTGCDYCNNCPVNIDIAASLKSLNMINLESKSKARVYHFLTTGQSDYNGKIAFAKNCIECGKCETKCPQSLDIIDKLKETAKELEKAHIRAGYTIMRKFVKK